MTGFKDSYVAVFEAVKTLLEKQKSLQQGQITYDKDASEIESLDKLPLLIITMTETKAVGTDGYGSYELKIPIVIAAVTVEYEQDNWFDNMITVMGAIVDALLDDPTLGSIVRDFVFVSFHPGKFTLQDRAFRGGFINFMATLDFTNT